MREQGCRAVAESKKREEELENKAAEQLLRVRREKKSSENKDAEKLLRVGRRVEETRMKSSCLV